MSTLPDSDRPQGTPLFPTTSWTLIQKVQKGSAADAARAMEVLCQQYWYPIYAYARRFGFSATDAEDVTQSFFLNLISHDALQAFRQDQGRMRTYMLAMLKHVIHKLNRHDEAEKRGGPGLVLMSFDEETAESRYLRELLADKNDLDLIFDRAWANDLLAAVDARLRADFAKADNLEDYEQMREFLPLGDQATPYAEAATRLGMTEGYLRVQIHRMRKRYAALIQAEIAQTVSDPAEQQAELEHLMAVIGK